MNFYENMKKLSIIVILTPFIILGGVGLLFLDVDNNPFFVDTDTSKKIVNQLQRDDIQAMVLLTIDNEWGNKQSVIITESFLIDGEKAPKIEIIYDPENPNYDNISINLSNAIKEHLTNYNSNEVAVIVIGFDEKEKELLKIGIYEDNLKLSELEWVWISE